MKRVAILALLALELAVSGCGSSSSSASTTASGNWEAQLTGGTGDASLLNFVTAFTVTDTTGVSNQPLNFAGIGFINSGACFATGTNVETETGTATLNTSSTGQVTGSLTFTVTSEATSTTQAGNVLTLTADPANGGGVSGTSSGTTTTSGTLSNGIVWGNWSLASSDPNCNGGATSPIGGTFIMCQNAATCTIP